MRFLTLLFAAAVVCALAVSLTACHSAKDTSQETLEYAKSMISLDGPATAHSIGSGQVEVAGPATNRDKFQHDVYFTATLLDAAGNTVGTATGKLEDWPAGHHGIYKLTGKVTSANWSQITVVVSNVKEHVLGQAED